MTGTLTTGASGSPNNTLEPKALTRSQAIKLTETFNSLDNRTCNPEFLAIKVLMIEDNPGDARLVQEMLLEAGLNKFYLTHVKRLSEALQHLNQAATDVILLDLSLPDEQGLDTLTRTHTRFPNVPIVVLTGLNDEAIAVQAVREGAQDYLVKGQMDGNVLVRAIRYAIERHGLIANLAQHTQELQHRELNFRNIITTNVDGMIIVDHQGIVRFVNPAAEALFGHQAEELVGAPLSIPIVTNEINNEVGIISKHGTTTIAEICVVETQWEGESVYLASLRDITERKQAEEALRQQTERERLVTEMTLRIRQSLDLEEILNTTVTEVQRFLQVDRVFIYRFEPDWSGMIVVESVNLGWPAILGRKTRDSYFEKASSRQAYIEGRVQAIADIYASGLSQCHIDSLTQFLMKANLVVPIVQGETLWGLLVANHCAEPRHWQQFEIDLLKQLATQVAIAIQQSELYQQAHIELTERKRAEAQLVHNALYDALTELPNRTLFMDRLKQACERAKRHQSYLFAVLFLDVDRFKVVNDSLGHVTGDQLLVVISQRLQVCLRPGDTIARLGGDEFTMLLDDIKSANDASLVAERIQRELALPLNLNGHEVFTSASIGIALSGIGHDQPESLLRDADTAMYRAKSLGKARHQLFDTVMHTQALSLLKLETDLRRAVERQELRIHYQPIVALATQRITGFEALVRWQHPERGLVSPAEFIPVAEETGLIIPIGHWVLYEACRQMQAWQEQLSVKQPLAISVNLSVKQFIQQDLIEQIDQILQQTGLDVQNLKLEITESVIMENTESATIMLSQLRALGIQLCMDDFGTGYSSLSYLHRFPINTLKIDRSFISSMSMNSENLEIVRTIIALARNLNLDVTAEGVETAEQLAQLRALQCEYGQGYFFSKPVDSEVAGKLIATQLLISP